MGLGSHFLNKSNKMLFFGNKKRLSKPMWHLKNNFIVVNIQISQTFSSFFQPHPHLIISSCDIILNDPGEEYGRKF